MQRSPFVFVITLFMTIFLGVSQAVNCTPGTGGSKVARTIVVDPSGKGNFKTIQGAIDSIPENNNNWIKVQVNAGIYIEQVNIPIEKPCIFLEGNGRGQTTVTYNAHQDTADSATFTSLPSNIVVKGITFENSFNRRLIQNTYNGIKSPGVLPALSARIYGDKSAFYDCAFLSVQDTLWDVNGRHHFSNCYIEGSVDFIYGAGQSFYEGCIINVTGGGFITAQGKEFPNDTNGFVFSRCYVTGVKGAKAYLGRAYRGYSTVIYNNAYLSDVVQPEGWFAWDYVGHEGNITYVEANCKGPGANTLNRVKWEKKLTIQQLSRFSKSSFIDQDGWLAKLPL
ncbi:probable pectinesterase 55 [Populus nigra]|uniref:probable pectinesterase 55 n=1 Tax=Populus nigra TaxID=3691 RepID=UPI002B2740D1|nr:probable pectinesterase 55 [Populus nigra]